MGEGVLCKRGVGGTDGHVHKGQDDTMFEGNGSALAVHVDDIITRGSRRATKLFWGKVQKKFELKGWDIVDYDNPLVYTGMTISKVTKDNKV